MDRNIKHVSDFKIVMSTINTIQSTTSSVELKIRDIQETYNVLEEHRIKVNILRARGMRKHSETFSYSEERQSKLKKNEGLVSMTVVVTVDSEN